MLGFMRSVTRLVLLVLISSAIVACGGATVVDPPPAARRSPPPTPASRTPRGPEVARVEYVVFPIRPREPRVEPEEVRAWMRTHADILEAEVASAREHFEDLPPHVRLRVLVADGEGGRERAESWLRRLRAGERFEDLARAESDDWGSGARGGDLGWTPRGVLDTALEDAAFAHESGVLPEPLALDHRFVVAEVLGHRQGDVPLDRRRFEVATQIVQWERASDRARDDAAWALERMRAGDDLEVALAERFPRDTPALERGPLFTRGEPAFPYDSGAVSEMAFTLTATRPVADAPVDYGNGTAFAVRLVERRRLRPDEPLPPIDAQRAQEGAATSDVMDRLQRAMELEPIIGYRQRPRHITVRRLRELQARRPRRLERLRRPAARSGPAGVRSTR